MLARGLVSLHTLPLLGRKSSLVKSRVSITSKLIESKRLQVLYFGHLRKTGGWGSYGHLTKDVHPEPAEGLFSIFRSFFLGRRALPISVPGAKGHQKFRVDQETREGEKSRSCRLKSPACEFGWEKDLGEGLFARIAPELKARPPKDEWVASELLIDNRWREEGCATRPAKFREHSLGARFLRAGKR